MRSVSFQRASRVCGCAGSRFRVFRTPALLTRGSLAHLLAAHTNRTQGRLGWKCNATTADDQTASPVSSHVIHTIVEAGATAADDIQLLQELEALGQGEAQQGGAGDEWVADEQAEYQFEPVENVVESVVSSSRNVASDEYESDEVEHQSLTPLQMLSRGVEFVQTNKYAQAGGVAILALLAATFGLAAYRTYQKYQSARAKRKRQVDKNKELVEELSKFLPTNQALLTESKVQGLQRQVGFSMVEMFRKYLWYLLQSRKFDESAVNDLVHLKRVMGLTDSDVAEALKERAQRIYNKYGTLMLDTQGMTDAGVQRKATCRALFQKLLYLTELEAMIQQDSEAAKSVNLREIFGATEDDFDGMRIVSLVDVDLDKLDRMASSSGGPGSIGDDDEPLPKTTPRWKPKN